MSTHVENGVLHQVHQPGERGRRLGEAPRSEGRRRERNRMAVQKQTQPLDKPASGPRSSASSPGATSGPDKYRGSEASEVNVIDFAYRDPVVSKLATDTDSTTTDTRGPGGIDRKRSIPSREHEDKEDFDISVTVVDSDGGEGQRHDSKQHGKKQPSVNEDVISEKQPTIDQAIIDQKQPAVIDTALHREGGDGGDGDPPSNSNQVRVLREQDAYDCLGFSFSNRKKWRILTSTFIVQISMNFNAAIYGNAVAGMMQRFKINKTTSKVGQMLFLVMYAFGCEAWAPWSEEIGRYWVMQGSLGLVNIWAMACALSPSFAGILAFRALGGLSSAGGSVTLGIVADMFEPKEQQYAVAYVVFASCAGSVIAPIVGGFMETYLGYHWNFWIQLIFGAVAQFIHSWVPETRASILLDREAQRRRKSGEDEHIYGPNEIRGSFWERISLKEIRTLMFRPYVFLATEPIVLFLSLLSGFSDALIFTGLDSFPLVLKLWDFTVIETGLAFIPLLLGYIVATLMFVVRYHFDRKLLRENPEKFSPERRLWLLLWLVLLEPIGLIMFGLGCYLSAEVHWTLPLFGTGLIGIANLAIYQATIDYMVAAYGHYSASATGGNGFCRDFLAGIAAMYTTPMYSNIMPGTEFQLPIPIWITCAIGALLCIPVYIFYVKGPWFRNRSKWAKELADHRAQVDADLAAAGEEKE